MIKIMEKLELWLFYGFLVAFTLSVRKVLFFYPIEGRFNEYSGIYLYLSDLFILGLLLVAAVSILNNKYIIKSIGNINFKAFLKQKVVIIPFLIVIFSFISTIWSVNWQIAIFRSIKFLEFYLLYLWLIFRAFPFMQRCSIRATMFHVERCAGQAWNIKDGTLLRNSLLIIIFTGVIQSLAGIWQFITQKSIGLYWLGESIISSKIDGVAKIVFDGEKYIRSYGLFPHPNILGGFLVLSILITILYFKIFYQEDNVPCGTSEISATGNAKCSMWNIRGRLNVWVLLAVQILALILTFSKSAWLGLVIALLFLRFRYVPRGTNWVIKNKQMFHLPCRQAGVEHIKITALVVIIIILILLVVKPDTYSFVGKSIEDRIFFLNVSRGTFFEHPILGIGSGQFVSNLKGLEFWQYQPVHNVFLLILNELGIIGLLLFLWFIWIILKQMFHLPCRQAGVEQEWNKHGTSLKVGEMVSKTFSGIFFGLILIMVVDHYLWDIQQGQIILWFTLGVFLGNNMWISSKSKGYPQEKGLSFDKM